MARLPVRASTKLLTIGFQGVKTGMGSFAKFTGCSAPAMVGNGGKAPRAGGEQGVAEMRNAGWAVALAMVAVVLPRGAAAQVAGVSGEEGITYRMAPHDTLLGLAAKYLAGPGAAQEVQRINRIRDPRRIPVGTVLAIPRRLLRFEPVALRIATFSGPVSLANGGTPERGQVLGEGMEIGTGANGFVTLAGADGSRVSLPSQSRVRVKESRRYLINRAASIEIEVLRGRAEVSAAKQAPQGQFRLRSPVAVSAVRGTVFRVGYAEDRATGTTEVIEGLVGVATPKAGLDLPAGFGAAARGDGEVAKESLLPAPDAPGAGRVQTDPEVAFALSPVAGAAGYRVQIARDAGFVEVIAESSGPAPEARFAGIGNGRLFMRANAMAPSGIEGLGQSFAFRRQQVGVKAEAGAVADGFRFTWLAEGEGQSLYRFQLFPAVEGQPPLVDEPALREPGLTLTTLRPGVYRWRVGVIQVTPDGSAEVWTPLEKLTVGD
jgi:hypothetical protein